MMKFFQKFVKKYYLEFIVKYINSSLKNIQ